MPLALILPLYNFANQPVYNFDDTMIATFTLLFLFFLGKKHSGQFVSHALELGSGLCAMVGFLCDVMGVKTYVIYYWMKT